MKYSNLNLNSAGGYPTQTMSSVIPEKDIANILLRLGLPALGGLTPFDQVVSPPLAALGDFAYEKLYNEPISSEEKSLNAVLGAYPGISGELARGGLAIGGALAGRQLLNKTVGEQIPSPILSIGGSDDLDFLFENATKPFEYKQAPGIFEGFKNMFKKKSNIMSEKIDLPSVGLGNVVSKSSLDDFAKGLGISGNKDVNKFGNALVNEVAPTLNKLDNNPLGFDTYAQNPFIPIEQRLAAESSPLSLRKELLMSSPFDEFTNEALSNFKAQDTDLDKYFGTAYDTIKNTYGDVKAPANRILNTIDEGFREIEPGLLKKKSYPTYKNVASEIKENALELQNSSGLPYEVIKKTRTQLNDILQRYDGVEGVLGEERGLLKQLRDSFTDSFSDLTDEAIKKGGNPEILDTLKKTNKQYAEYKTDINSPVGESLEKLSETGKQPKDISEFLKQFNTEEDVVRYSRLTKIPREKLKDQVYGSILDEQFTPRAYAQRTDGITAPEQKLYTQGFDSNTNSASVKRLHTALTKNRKNLVTIGGKDAYLENVAFVNALNKISNKGKAWENIFRGIDNTSNKGKKIIIDTTQLDNLVAKNPNLFSPEEKVVLNKVIGLNNRFSENQQNAMLKILNGLLKKAVPHYGTVTDLGSKFSS